MTDMELMLAKANHVEAEKYPQLVEEEIRKTHKTSGNEIAILRKTVHALIHGDPIPEEFEAYHAEAERKKASIKERLNGV